MRRGFFTTILSCGCLALLTLPGTAGAAIAVESFSFGLSTAQAGAHPDVTVDISFAEPGEPETPQDAFIELPRGLFLYPWTLPRCVPQQVASDECPLDSQVGVVDVHSASFGDLEKTPVYLGVPEPDELARLVFDSLGFSEPVEVPVRAGAANGYSLSLAFEGLPEAMPVATLELSLWGVPPAPIHDQERGPHASEVPGGRQAHIAQTPFTRNPTACGATSATAVAHSYEDAEDLSAALASGPTITGCDKLSFDPITALGPTAAEAASTTGLGFEYRLPQDLLSNGLATSDTEALALYLQGLTVNEAAASSRAVCTLAQANLFTEVPATCPAASKIASFGGALTGTDEVLEGSVYFGGLEGPGEYLLLLVASGAGLELKLPAWLVAGSEAELVIPELPQLPLEDLDLQFNPATSLFLNPPRCGTFAAITEAIGRSQPDLASVASTPFLVDSGPNGGPCPEPQAGGSSPPPTTGAAPAPTAPKPPVTVELLKHPPHRGRDRTPTFRFASNLPDSSFECKIDRRKWRSCHSPLTLRKLGVGNHTFRVKARAAGAASRTLSFRFVIAPGGGKRS
ncbi:MAG TPA: hypothetical protein VFP17_06795 [Solirubrobacterales bacterium]|nr:hypothetical protein [Solirubrobacterales bacterium]